MCSIEARIEPDELICPMSLCAQLWGSDRVLRTIQYGSRMIGGSPEASEEIRVVANTFSKAFSQAR